MDNFEDYYEILQVSPSAEQEVVKAAYNKLANKYHPDHNPNNPAAEEKMKKLSVAYAILSDPEQRKKYHVERLRRKGSTDSSSLQPKPIVDPQYIQFKNVKPGWIRRASFLVINTGGPYSKIWIDNPNSWVRVTSWRSLSSSDELPLKVYIEVEGKDWTKIYSHHIRVKLDSAEAQVKVELRTQLLIKDHKWHDIDYDDLKAWIKNRKDRLDAGEELKGKIFRYRLNRSTGKYQVRSRNKFDKAVYDPLH